MPQPKSASRATAAKGRATDAKPAAKKPAASRSTGAKAGAAGKPAAGRSAAAKTRAAASKPAASRSASKASGTARKPAASRSTAKAGGTSRSAGGRSTAAKPSARRGAAAKTTTGSAARPTTTAGRARGERDALGQLVGALREQLSNRVFEPLDLVLLAGERIQEAVDEAVERGRMTRGDANDLAGDLVRKGRKQTDDVLGNLDELLGRGLEQLEQLSRKAARARRADSVDRLMRSADKARRAVGVGPSFPILGYDDLSAKQIAERLGDLKPAELRKVRDYETRHANRKSVLAALDRKLR